MFFFPLQTSGLAFGGLSNPPVVMRALTESWNGSGWTEVGDLNTSPIILLIPIEKNIIKDSQAAGT